MSPPWFDPSQGQVMSDDQYSSSVLPGLRSLYPTVPGQPWVVPAGGTPGSADPTKPKSVTPWWRRAVNALGEVAPYLQNIPNPEAPPSRAQSTGQWGFRGRQQGWQAPQATRLADWSTPTAGLMPRFYRSAGTYAEGGDVRPAEQMAEGGASPSLYRGPGGGQDDQMPALVSPGEYIFSAGDVAMLGDGNNEEGARRLDQMRGALRRHLTSKREGHPPMAHDPMSYLRGGR
jgi:hypothetical protein